ncbi:hypothetical protein LEP1GSC043_1356 [Leptospira weilii str. Ecochallenge]|uniref:Uncharacterized protein n=1 Tax=Leptospira weilii str. Ecochallenge TaxID=1049986 RepID=N1U3X8_9LEPT|nr:hypothetical protein LEP1GSC043_1356 [Leptospira weilii str. Ecochallenge]
MIRNKFSILTVDYNSHKKSNHFGNFFTKVFMKRFSFLEKN